MSFFKSKSGLLYSWSDANSVLSLQGSPSSHPSLVEPLKNETVKSMKMTSHSCACLTENGECFIWGSPSSYTGRLLGLKSSSSSAPVNITTLLSQPITDISRVFLTMNQIVIEREQNPPKIAHSIPFLVDLKLETFQMIRDILNRYFPVTSGNMEDTVPNESEECVSVSMINLLTLQVRAAMAHGMDLSCPNFAPVVRSLKDIVCHFASSPEALESLVSASQRCLKVCWPVLLPTSKERAVLLLQFLNSQTKDENLLFLIELLVSSFLTNDELKLELESTINNLWSSMENSEMFATMKNKFKDSDGLDVDLTAVTAGPHHVDVNLYNFENVVEQKLLDSQIVRLVSQLLENCQNIQITDISNPPKSHKLLTKFMQLVFVKIISSKASTANFDGKNVYRKKFNKHVMYTKLLINFAACLTSNAVRILTKGEEKAKCSQKDFFACADKLKSNSVLVLLKELLYTLTSVLKPCEIELEAKHLSDCLATLVSCLNKFNKHSPRLNCEELSFSLNVFEGSEVSLEPLGELPKIPDYVVHNHNVSGGHWLNLKGLVYNFDNYSSLPSKIADFVKSCQDGKEAAASEELLACLNNYLIGEQVCEKDLIDCYSPDTIKSTSPFLQLEQVATFLIGYSCGLSFEAEQQTVSGSATWEETISSIIFEYGLKNDAVLDKLQQSSLTTEQVEALKFLKAVSAEHEQRAQSISQEFLAYRESSKRTSEVSDDGNKVSQFLSKFWKYCSQTLHCAVFEASHPLEEVSLVLLILLMKHQNLLSCVNKVESPAENSRLLDTARRLVKFRTNVIKKHQELNASYKELCNPYFERSMFLLDNLRCAFMQTKLQKLLNGLSHQKIGSKWEKLLRKVELSKKSFLSDLNFPKLNSTKVNHDEIRDNILHFVLFGPDDCNELMAQFQVEKLRQTKM